MNKANLYKLSNTVVSLLIGIVAVYFLYNMFQEKSASVDFSLIGGRLKESYASLLIVFVLMIFNWGIELFKWNYLLQRLQKLSFKELITSLNLGILLSLLTPNRIGEFGGRQLYVKESNRLASFYFQSFCALSQLLVTILMGLIAFGFYAIQVESNYKIAMVFFLLSTALMLLYLNSNVWFKWLSFFQRKFSSFLKGEVTRLKTIDRIKILGLSFFRYLIFGVQFILLYNVFQLNATPIFIFLGIAAVFFITAVIPTGWISDVAVRTSVAFYIFDKIELSGVDAMVCSILLWIINLLIPAILGLPHLSKVNWTRIKKAKL